VTKLVFNQKQTFMSGNISVPVLDIPFIEINTPRGRLILASVAFSALGLGVVAIRRSRLGRRLIALKDSPAAAATLGMSLTRTKLAAFAISAGIAACAGALAGDKVSPQQYDFTQSLPIVLLTVVGGVGTVGGALFGGLMLGGNSVLATVVPTLKNVTKILPGTIGITLGRNPSGAVNQIADAYRSLTNRWNLLAFAAAGGIVIWILDAQYVISHWAFFIAGVFWILAVTPNLVGIMQAPKTRRIIASSYLGIGFIVAISVDWDNAVDSTGKRLIALILLIALFGVGAQRIAENAPRVHRSSPDVIGLTKDFTDEELDRAERELGVVI
jgi:hypothetical protein